MSAPPPLGPDVRVICVHALGKLSFLIGQVGVIKERADDFVTLVSGAHWVVDFPATAGRICPDCGGQHGPLWPMRSNELRPLHDPDSDSDLRITEEPLETIEELGNSLLVHALLEMS